MLGDKCIGITGGLLVVAKVWGGEEANPYLSIVAESIEYIGYFSGRLEQ